MAKTYLGDGVYADIVEDSLRLTTEDGMAVTNVIYLEPEVVSALVNYLRRILASHGLEFCPECERRTAAEASDERE